MGASVTIQAVDNGFIVQAHNGQRDSQPRTLVYDANDFNSIVTLLRLLFAGEVD